MLLDRITRMLHSCESESPFFPPTELYNEGWLLRIILDWFSKQRLDDHPLAFSESARWFSEALLPSAFLPRSRQDPLGESWTHADGVIGQFTVGTVGRANLALVPDVRHFVVLEAKMFSKLSPGVTNARYFDQAARSVACISEVLKRANLTAGEITRLGFYVLAPEIQISSGIFKKKMDKTSIAAKVERRVEEYGGEKDQWLEDWFKPTLDHIVIDCLSWEELLEEIDTRDSRSAAELEEFYRSCLRFNSRDRIQE